jgi:SAM-dependent methyltransferase
VTARSDLGTRIWSTSARALAIGGDLAIQASNKLSARRGSPTLRGERWVEWSFTMARLADGPGTTLDFGADVGFLSLAAAQRGHEVVALDRLPSALDYAHDRVTQVQADILDRPLSERRFDQIVNCSSVEHVGLSGRYGSTEDRDGDLKAMTHLRELLSPEGRMILTIPVGQDAVCHPKHRIYGEARLPRLLEGYLSEEEQYWRKPPGDQLWAQTDRTTALAVEGSATYYALGLLVLRPGL